MNEQGFTLIENLLVLGVVGILAATAFPNFKTYTLRAYDARAASEYRNVRVAVMNAVTEPGMPDTFTISRTRGPAKLPYPINAVSISADTEATVVHQTRLTRNARPATTTRITVQNLRGSKVYQFTEINGVITEQVVSLP